MVADRSVLSAVSDVVAVVLHYPHAGQNPRLSAVPADRGTGSGTAGRELLRRPPRSECRVSSESPSRDHTASFTASASMWQSCRWCT